MKKSRDDFSKGRRNTIKAGLGAAASVPLAAVSIVSSNTASAAVDPNLCVRSPWAYYSLRSDSIDPNNETVDEGNEGLPSMVPLDSDTGQWLENVDWWTGNGASRALEIPWSTDVAGFDRVLIPNDSAFLLGIEVLKPAIPPMAEVIFRMGKSPGGGLHNGLEMKINAAGRVQLTLWDDAGASVVMTSRQILPNTNGGHACLFVYIDKREAGSQTMALYNYEAGSVLQNNRVVDISSLGPITGGPIDSTKNILIGARRDPSGTYLQYFNGQLRGLNVINFGATPPSYVNSIMDDLSVSHMQPDPVLNGA